MRELSVVIACYNEADRIEASLRKLFNYLESRYERWEIIVVDDGSRDGTAPIVKGLQRERPQLVLISYPENRGKGYAVRQGILKASREFILISDADLAAPVEELERLKDAVLAGYDGAIGSREIKADGCYVEDHWMRRLAGRVFNRIVRGLALASFRDTQCGFKLFRREPLKAIARDLRVEGFGFDVEMLYLAGRRGMRLREVAVNWSAKPGSKVRLFPDAFKMLRDALLVKRYHG